MESATLVASGGVSYLWNIGETTNSISVTLNVTTIYTVTVSDGNNSDSHEVIVTVNQLPVVDVGSDISICSGENVTLTATGIGDFLWSTRETTSSITVNPTRTTTYTLSTTGGGVTNSDAVIVTVENCSAIIEEDKSKKFIVYPNPTIGILNIKAN